MGRTTDTRTTRKAALLTSAMALLAFSGCQSEDFRNEERPPEPVALTGVITDSRVTISPNNIGTGPVIIRVSNQTDRSHTVSLVGQGVDERVGPINPLDTAELQKTLTAEGVYTVRAGSLQAQKTIPSGKLIVGGGRQSSRDDVQLP